MALSFYLPASAGQLSAGQGGFMALGAYTSAYLTAHLGVPFPLALVAGGLVGGLVGLAVGFPALRLGGLYLVLVTFGFGEMVRVLFLNAPAWRGGLFGLVVMAMRLVRPRGRVDAALLARLSPRGERAAAHG